MSIVSKKTIALEISDTDVRVVVATGRRVRRAVSTTLEPGMVQNGVVINQEEVAKLIRHLLQRNRIHTRRVSVGISGLHSLTLVVTLPQLPDVLVAEAIMREAGRVLPVPLDQLYVSWHRVATPDKRLRAFVVGVPRSTADAVFTTLNLAGLAAQGMDIKPMALARMAPEATSILLDVQPSEFDIVVLGDGIPHPIRSIPIPAEGLTPTDRLAIIREDLVRTIEFYNANHAESPLSPETPVYVTGELALDPEMQQALSADVGRPVVPLAPPVSGGPADIGRFTASMGIILGRAGAKPAPASLVARMDALPEAFRPQSFSPARVVVLTASVLVVAAMVAQAFLIQRDASAMGQSTERLNTITEIIEQRRLRQIDLKRSLAAVEATHEMLSSAVAELNQMRSNYNHYLAVTTNSLPQSVSVMNIKDDGAVVEITIESATEGPALGYARTLVSSGAFSDVVITTVSNESERETLRFVITAVVGE